MSINIPILTYFEVKIVLTKPSSKLSGSKEFKKIPLSENRRYKDESETEVNFIGEI